MQNVFGKLISLLHMKKGHNDWICTDGSKLQYGRYIGGTTWEFKQFDQDEFADIFVSIKSILSAVDIPQSDIWKKTGLWLSSYIDTSMYSMRQKRDILSAYFNQDDTEALLSSNLFEDWFIIAECIFEQQLY